MCTKDCSSGTNDTMHAEKKRSRSTNWGVHFLGARVWSFFFAFFCMKLYRNDTQVSMFADFANDIFLWFNLCMDIEFWIDGESTRSLRDQTGVQRIFAHRASIKSCGHLRCLEVLVVSNSVIMWLSFAEVFLGFFTLRFHSLRQRIVLCDEDSTGVDPDPGRCPGKQGASMVTDRIQSNRVFLPRRPFSISSLVAGRGPLRKISDDQKTEQRCVRN